MKVYIRKSVFLLVIFFLTLSCISKAQTFKNPVEYMDYIGVEYGKINNDLWTYLRTAGHSRNARKIDKRRSELINTIDEARKKIRKMPGYQGDYSYRDSVVNFLTLNYYVMKEDYARIVDMEEIAEQSYDLMEAYLTAREVANNKLSDTGKRLHTEQLRFATNYKINLVDQEDEISNNIEKAGEVISYYDKVFLLFFKCFKQESNVMEAISGNKISLIEQQKNSLISYCEEGLNVLEETGNYNNDPSLRRACKLVLTYFLEEANNEIPKYVDFLLIKEKMDKLRESIDAKRPAERTKSEIEQYNASVADYNNGVSKINTLFDELNNQRKENLEAWNGSVSSFMDKHIPR